MKYSERSCSSVKSLQPCIANLCNHMLLINMPYAHIGLHSYSMIFTIHLVILIYYINYHSMLMYFS